MSEYRKTLQFLYDLQLLGIKAGLDNIKSLLSFLGHPEERIQCIHIAGTNGKGSTAAMIASILTASGYKTGLYTSPHLVDFSERIRINGHPISEAAIVEYTRNLRSKIKERQATFFEATTAIAFQYFVDQQTDIAVIETGLGGRWDATNVVTPMLSIITNVGLEHTEYLGTTYSQIAFEKGGIIKSNISCLTGTLNKLALQTLRQIARRRAARLIHTSDVSRAEIHQCSLSGIRLDLHTKEATYRDLFVSLAGNHQAMNAQLAVLSVEELHATAFDRISEKSIREGLQSVRKNSGIRGRIDVLSRKPLVVADVAHNPDAMRTLVNAMREMIVGKAVAVFGIMRDKDHRSILEILGQLSRLMICVEPKSNRALPSREIVRESHQMRLRAIDGHSIIEGLRRAKIEARDNELILVTGSHYVVGGVLHSCIFPA